MKGQPWTQQEQQSLITLFGTMPTKQLQAEHLQNRSLTAIKNMAWQYNLTKTGRGPYTPEETEIVSQYIRGLIPLSEASRQTGKSMQNILSKVNRMKNPKTNQNETDEAKDMYHRIVDAYIRGEISLETAATLSGRKESTIRTRACHKKKYGKIDKAAATKPVETAQTKPTKTASKKPDKTATTKPVETAQATPVETTMVKPVETTMVEPAEATPVKPPKAVPEKPVTLTISNDAERTKNSQSQTIIPVSRHSKYWSKTEDQIVCNAYIEAKTNADIKEKMPELIAALPGRTELAIRKRHDTLQLPKAVTSEKEKAEWIETRLNQYADNIVRTIERYEQVSHNQFLEYTLGLFGY